MLFELDPSNRLPDVRGTACMQVTGQEAARRWAALQLRPEAALLVGRFAVETSELLRVELLRCRAAFANLSVVRQAVLGSQQRYMTI